MDLVRIRTIADVIHSEGFRRLPKPLHRVAARRCRQESLRRALR